MNAINTEKKKVLVFHWPGIRAVSCMKNGIFLLLTGSGFPFSTLGLAGMVIYRAGPRHASHVLILIFFLV